MRGLAAAVLLLLTAPAARADEPPQTGLFPDSHHLFARLLADPRQAQTSARYYRLDGRDTADVALGNTWGMRRWRLGRDGDWQVQWNVEGMGFSRFLLSGAVNVRFSDQAEGRHGASRGASRSKARGVTEQAEGSEDLRG